MLLDKQRLSADKNIVFSSIESDKFKASVLAFTITLPLTPEAVAYNLLLSGLLRRGTQKKPSMAELNRSLDELYGSYVEIKSTHVGNNLSLVITTEVLDNKYIPDGTDTIGGVIDTVADILLSPIIKNKDFDRQIFAQERKIVEEALDAEKNNTRSYSIKKCAELLREGLSLYPTTDRLKELVSSATFEKVLAHYRDIISNYPLEIFYIGATAPSLIREKILSAFEEYSCNADYQVVPLKPYKRDDFISLTEKMSVSQGKLAMGFSTGVHISKEDDRYYTALMLNEIFGGSASSKLFLNVREKMSLCYYCSSTFSIYTGIMMVSSGIEVSKLDIAKAAILDQLRQIKLGNISEYEFEAARRSISNSYLQLYDSPFDMQAFHSGRSMFGVTDDIEDCRRKLIAVTPEDVAELAKQITLDAVFFIEGTENGSMEDGEND